MPTSNIESGEWIDDGPSGATDEKGPETQDEYHRAPDLQIVPVSETETNRNQDIPPFSIDPNAIERLIRQERQGRIGSWKGIIGEC